MATSIVRAKGQVTIPNEIRQAAGLAEGDPVEVEMTPDGILLRPQKLIDASQAWFWTDEWQARERQASADIAAGKVTRYGSGEELLSALKSRAPRRGADPKGAVPARRRKGRPS